ncbi:ABC-type transport auxiliary lipoprotein family protein [Marinobacter sp.]|uniref:ABC-type transport auxiliary lipoprotein family protein n=1 Tax=Marinobacter sp. TaxID=50741 RepID=UPI00356333F2
MLRAVFNASCFGLIALAAGCTVFPNPEPPRFMEMAMPEVPRQSAQRIPASLRVDTPLASEPLNGSLILAKPSPREFRAYEGVRWRDTVPVVVRDALVGAIRQSDLYTGVITDTNPARADLTLATELSGFHAESPESGPEVVIEVHLQMIHNRSRASLCNDTVRVVEPASGSSIDEIVDAFGAAGGDLAARVIEWARTCDYPSRLLLSPETDPPRQP